MPLVNYQFNFSGDALHVTSLPVVVAVDETPPCKGANQSIFSGDIINIFEDIS